jgi:putative membrane protein
MPYGWHNQGMGGGWWALMLMGMIIFLALFIVAMVALSRHYNQRPNGSLPEKSANRPIEILNERLAHGEVTEEEYSRRLALLRGQQ